MRKTGFLFFLCLSVLSLEPSARAMEACDSGLATLKLQSKSADNSSAAGAIQKAINDAALAKDHGDQAACLSAVRQGLGQMPAVGEKWMVCHGGIMAMRHAIVADPTIANVLEGLITSAELDEQAGKLDSCVSTVRAGMAKTPGQGKALEACLEGRAQLRSVAERSTAISGVLRSAIDGSGAELIAGDMIGCSATATKALAQN